MAFNPDNQQLLSLSVSEGTDYFVRKNLNYLMYTTAVGTGIGGTIGGANRIYTNTAKPIPDKGLDLISVTPKMRVIVGDKVVLTVSEAGSPLPSTQTYDVIKVITPEIQKKSGQYVSFQNIKSTPISVKTPQTNRTYEFDISINITDITS
jgi:hypothetical protein